MAPEISITIPIYNEEGSIEKTVRNLVKAFEDVDYELVLVNHGSWDNTEKILNKLGKENKRLNVINLAKNRGYGGGIMYGMEHSKGEIIGWTCADEEVSAEDTYKIYSAIRDRKNDVVKALRTKRTDGWFRKLTSWVFNTLIAMRFRLKIKDVNGYPLFFKKEFLKKISPKERAHLFNLDLVRNMKKQNMKILEIPVIHRKRQEGKTFMKLPRVFEMTLDFFKYALK
ncbi:MAG: glycosyltransferase family 2 protein [Nanoarchaeota archaeon]|nr:glycosyltransferase family 2 protein [Nanoarchaeota archaeon]